MGHPVCAQCSSETQQIATAQLTLIFMKKTILFSLQSLNPNSYGNIFHPYPAGPLTQFFPTPLIDIGLSHHKHIYSGTVTFNQVILNFLHQMKRTWSTLLVHLCPFIQTYIHTACPRSSCSFHIVSYYIKQLLLGHVVTF